jgi:hypothetical protein
MKPVINKWQVHFYFGKDWTRYERGWKEVDFGILKIHTLPEQGHQLHKKMYGGFLIRFFIWFPIDS